MKSVYTGGEKVAEFNDYSELRLGDSNPAFIYEGNELVYPNPVKDGLVLWYDFSGRTNADSQRGIAEDLSGNGNHGTLQNFNYTSESGYDKNKLLFDGVDDSIPILNPLTNQDNSTQRWSVEMVVKVDNLNINNLLNGWNTGITARNRNGKVRMLNYTNLTGYLYNDLKYTDIGTYIHIVATYDYISQEVKMSVDNNIQTKLNDVGYMPSGINSEIYLLTNVVGGAASLKIYNRPLTASEIAHNYAIEKERFGIE